VIEELLYAIGHFCVGTLLLERVRSVVAMNLWVIVDQTSVRRFEDMMWRLWNCVVSCNNKSVVSIVHNLVQHDKTKHTNP